MYRDHRDLIQENLSFGDSQPDGSFIQYTPNDYPTTNINDALISSPVKKRNRSERFPEHNYENNGQSLFSLIQSQENTNPPTFLSQEVTHGIGQLHCDSFRAESNRMQSGDNESKVKLRSVINHFLPGQPPKPTTRTIWLGSALEKPRYNWDFIEEGELGRGVHSSVFVARHRLDGSLYAIKKLYAHLDEERPTFIDVKEVCANVALKGCPNLVQYFGSWIEDNHLWIQMELCLRVNLDIFVNLMPPPPPLNRTPSSCNLFADMDESLSQSTVTEEKATPQRSLSMIKKDHSFGERAFWKVLHSVSTALEFMHSKSLAHMDIRPANMFISPAVPNPRTTPPPMTSPEKPPLAASSSLLKRKLSFPPVFLPPPPPAASNQERTLSDCESVTCFTQRSMNDGEILCWSSQTSNPPFPLGQLSCPSTPLEELPPLEMSQSETLFETHRKKTSDSISAREVNDNLSNGIWEVKLGDLGLCCRCDDYSSFTEGESRYFAPELIQLPLGTQDFTKADIFSLGASLVEMCLGRGLHLEGDEWHKLRDGRFQTILNDYEVGGQNVSSAYAELMNYSSDVRDILKQMLAPQHSKRPDATTLRQYSHQRLHPEESSNSGDDQHQLILNLHERIRALEAELDALKNQK